MIRCDKNEILKAISAAAGAVDGRSLFLKNCLIRYAQDELQVTGTDNDLMVRTTVECSSNEPGEFLADPKKLREIISAMKSGDIIIHPGKEKATLSQESLNGSYSFLKASPDNYPSYPEVEGGIDIEAEFIRDVLTKTQYAAARDTVKPVFSGILLTGDGTKIKAAATDSKRLAMAEHDCAGEKFRCIIPISAIGEILKYIGSGPCQIMPSENTFMLKSGSVEIWTRLIGGEFPDVSKVVPAECRIEVTANKAGLLEVLRRIVIFAPAVSAKVRISLSPGDMIFRAQNSDYGEGVETLRVKSPIGGSINLSVNVKYLQEAVNAIDDEFVTIGINDATSPVLIRPHLKEGDRKSTRLNSSHRT